MVVQTNNTEIKKLLDVDGLPVSYPQDGQMDSSHPGPTALSEWCRISAST